MSLEEKVGKDLTYKEAMEGFRQHLNVRRFRIAMYFRLAGECLQAILSHPVYCAISAYSWLQTAGETNESTEKAERAFEDMIKKEAEETYRKAGCETKEEKEACDIAYMAIGCLQTSAALIQRTKGEAKVPKGYFEHNMLEDGIRYSVEYHQGEAKHEEYHKAYEWLRDEIYARAKGKEIKLLDMVSVMIDEAGTVSLNDLTFDWKMDKKIRGSMKNGNR